jgi:hypothetical protein
MKRITCLMAAAALSGLAAVGCDRDDTSTTSSTGYNAPTTSTRPAVDVDVDVNKDKVNNAADNAVDATKRGLQKTGEVAKEIGRDARDAAVTAGRKVDNAVDRTVDGVRNNVNVDVRGTDAQQAGARGTTAPNGTAAAPDAEGIRDVLAQVAEAAATKGGLDDLGERLAKADRDRLNQGLNQTFSDVDGRVDQFRKDWQAKYNQEFDIKNEEQAFPNSTFGIAQSEVAAGADAGRNTATVQIAASHGLPALTVPMVHEAPDRWKIDVPDTLTADKLKANVLAHLTAADEMRDQWPADVNEAYGMVTHHILMALLDQPAQQR